MAARALTWSSTPHDLLPSIIGRQPVASSGHALLRAALRQVFDALYEERRL